MNDWVQIGADLDEMLDGLVELARQVPINTPDMTAVFNTAVRNLEVGELMMAVLATAINRLAAPTTENM